MSDLFGRKENVKAVTILLFLASFLLLLFGYFLYPPLFLCEKYCGEIIDIRPGYVRHSHRHNTKPLTSDVQIISCVDYKKGLVQFFYYEEYTPKDTIKIGKIIESYCTTKSIAISHTDWPRMDSGDRKPFKTCETKDGQVYKINYKNFVDKESFIISIEDKEVMSELNGSEKYWTISITIFCLFVLCIFYKYKKWPNRKVPKQPIKNNNHDIINGKNVRVYKDFDYTIYSHHGIYIIGVVFVDKKGAYCRYFNIEKPKENSDEYYESLADDIRAHVSNYESNEIIAL